MDELPKDNILFNHSLKFISFTHSPLNVIPSMLTEKMLDSMHTCTENLLKEANFVLKEMKSFLLEIHDSQAMNTENEEIKRLEKLLEKFEKIRESYRNLQIHTDGTFAKMLDSSPCKLLDYSSILKKT